MTPSRPSRGTRAARPLPGPTGPELLFIHVLDKKAWIVLAICGVLLALNMHYMGKKQRLEAESKKAKAEEEAKKEKEAESPSEPGTPGTPEAPPKPKVDPEKFFTLKTDKVEFRFTNYGGGVVYAEQVDQFAVNDKEAPLRLNDEGEAPVGRLTNGVDEFLDRIIYHADKVTDTSISFFGTTKDGLGVRKTWSLLEGEDPGRNYRLRFELKFINAGEEQLVVDKLGLFVGVASPLQQGGRGEDEIRFFYLRDDDYKSRKAHKFKKGKKPVYDAEVEAMGFAGVSNNFFATILTPEKPYDGTIWGNRQSVRIPNSAGGGVAEGVRMGMSLPAVDLEGKSSVVHVFDVYMGPKLNQVLRDMGQDRSEAMSYGTWFFIGHISRALNWLLNTLYGWFFYKGTWGWGWAIVVLTIIIRGLMWPLQNKSTRAMKRMSKLQPQMAELKEKHGDDPQKVNQEMMKLYQQYGINPLGGCLPLLVQIPIFFGFYSMLIHAAELRQHSFLWVKDLSQPDTIYNLPFDIPWLGSGVNLLPIVMAATMVLQMALTPKTGDKMQRRIFMLMPIIFFFFCYNFASALALYWTVSNIFAIVQMMITKRLPEPELKKKKTGQKGFFQKMQERAEAAQQAQKSRRSEMMGGQKPKKPKKRRPRTGG